jgi:hexosaminidase
MGWEEIMTKDMSKSAIIHSWKEGINEGLSKEVLLAAAKWLQNSFIKRVLS